MSDESKSNLVKGHLNVKYWFIEIYYIKILLKYWNIEWLCMLQPLCLYPTCHFYCLWIENYNCNCTCSNLILHQITFHLDGFNLHVEQRQLTKSCLLSQCTTVHRRNVTTQLSLWSILMLVTSKRSKHLHNLPTSITIGSAQIPFKQSVKNFGFTLDCHLTMNAHVSNIAWTCYFELCRLASIRRFLTSTATATLVSTFVLSRIDYCNSLLFGSTHDCFIFKFVSTSFLLSSDKWSYHNLTLYYQFVLTHAQSFFL